jgi:hypothetical protein
MDVCGTCFIFLLPSAVSPASSMVHALMNVELLWVTAIYQMMRGAKMICAAGLAIIFLNPHLNKWYLACFLSFLVPMPLYLIADCSYLYYTPPHKSAAQDFAPLHQKLQSCIDFIDNYFELLARS